MSTVRKVTDYLEQIAPVSLQEGYDNAGLITGDSNAKLTGVLITLDCTEAVVEEAISKGTNLVIAHHPIVFKGIKRLNGKSYVERTIIKAIKNDIAIYAIHTNLDNISEGVNARFAEKLGLINTSILRPIKNLQQLVTFIPKANTREVLDAMHEAGAGTQGDYSGCSFRVTGKGRFTPGVKSSPMIGKQNITEEVEEDRVEVILPETISGRVISALKKAHPYEEVAYYLTSLENFNQNNGAGLIGELDSNKSIEDFLNHLKASLDLEVIKHTKFDKEIKKVAICGGSGSFLLKDAMASGADAFITGDVKYHDFFDAEDRILYCDIGHYESEVATKDLLLELLTKKFTNFAFYLSEIGTNPIKYFK